VDWDHIDFGGGSIGQLGAPALPSSTEYPEPSLSELTTAYEDIQQLLANPPQSPVFPPPQGLTAAARVRLRLERAQPGRRRRGRCVPPRQAPRGRRCTRFAALRGSLTHNAGAGANSLRLGGALGRSARRRGTYRLTATPIAPDGRTGTPRSATFTIR